MIATASTLMKLFVRAHAIRWSARVNAHARRHMAVTTTVDRGTIIPTRKSVRQSGHGALGISGPHVPLLAARGDKHERECASQKDAGPIRIVRLVRVIKSVNVVVGGSSGMMISGTSVAADNIFNTRKRSTERECAIALCPIRT